MGRAVLLLTTMVAVLLAYAGAALAQPSEKIFFGRWLYKDCPGFCMMNPNGGGSQSIKLHDSASDAAPSPDGSKIAYVAGSPLGEPGSNGELWVMNADGSGRTQLTKTMYAEETDPSWSPDGSKLAYTRRSFEPDSPTPSYLAEIWTINIDGSANTRLTTAHYEYFGFDRWGLEAVRSTTASDPDWSSDGSRIAFARSETWPDHTHGRYVYTMNADGGGLTNLTAGPDHASTPDWSPDGGKIAFESYGSIFVMNANGSGRTLLTNTDVSASDATMPMVSDPYWSPDGSRIAFDHRIDGQSYSDIWTMNADGSGETAITSGGEHKLFGWGLHDLPDVAKPTVSGMRPKPGSATSDRTPTISATVKDDATDLSGDDITLYVAGSQVTTFAYDGATDKLTYTPPKLAKGKKTVKIVATDDARNVGTKSWSFTVQ